MAEGWERFKKEVGQMVDQKAAQGCTEIAQGLYNGQSNAFTPYGHGQDPLPVDASATTYQDTLKEAAQRGQDQEIGIDR